MPLPLENQVCSLDLAKRLKDLGVRQESYFDWVPSVNGPFVREKDNDLRNPKAVFSAFTVAELGEMLPPDAIAQHDRFKNCWQCWFEGNEYQELHNVTADTEADGRAKMLIYLIENDLLKADHINQPSPNA